MAVTEGFLLYCQGCLRQLNIRDCLAIGKHSITDDIILCESRIGIASSTGNNTGIDKIDAAQSARSGVAVYVTTHHVTQQTNIVTIQ